MATLSKRRHLCSGIRICRKPTKREEERENHGYKKEIVHKDEGNAPISGKMYFFLLPPR